VFGGDESSARVAIALEFGLPPGGILLAHNLQDISHPECQACLLARDHLIVSWIEVKKRLYKHLKSKREREREAASKLTLNGLK